MTMLSAVSYGRVLWLGAALVGVVLLLAIIVLSARRSFMKSLRGTDGEEAFSIEKLQEMRDSGQISPEEFAFLRRQALGLPPADPEAGEPEKGETE